VSRGISASATPSGIKRKWYVYITSNVLSVYLKQCQIWSPSVSLTLTISVCIALSMACIGFLDYKFSYNQFSGALWFLIVWGLRLLNLTSKELSTSIRINTMIYVPTLINETRWSSGQCVRRATRKQCAKGSVIGWMIKEYLELLCASKSTLNRWSRLPLQSLASSPISRRLTSGRRPVVKIIGESLS
jgi:hypothetical protein